MMLRFACAYLSIKRDFKIETFMETDESLQAEATMLCLYHNADETTDFAIV